MNAFFFHQMVDIHKEKVARREIGQLASGKNIVRLNKLQPPQQKERQQKYSRVKMDFTSFDHIGHGVRVGDPTAGIIERPKPNRGSTTVSDITPLTTNHFGSLYKYSCMYGICVQEWRRRI